MKKYDQNQRKGAGAFAAKANVALIAAAVLAVSSYLSFADRSTVSSVESRLLAEYPNFTMQEYFSGNYTSDLMTWYTDTAPNRDSLKNGIVHIKNLFGVPSYLKVYGGDSEKSKDERPVGEVSDPFADYSRESSKETSPDSSAETSIETSVPAAEESVPVSEPSETSDEEPPDVEIDVLNGLIIFGDRCMEAFGGTYEVGQLYAKYVNNYKKDLGSKVNVYSMVIPVASSLYLEGDDYLRYGGNQIDKLEYVKERLLGTGVIPVDVYETLYAHKDEDIYFRTDHHWTALGAYYGGEALAKAAGLPFKSLFTPGTNTFSEENYTLKRKTDEKGGPKDFLGSLYGETLSKALLDNPDQFTWYEYTGAYTCEWYSYDYAKLKMKKDSCFLNVSDAYASAWYMTFLDGDNYSVKIKTDVQNGRVAVVFKDSFGNALIPMLLSSFETIYAIDLRYFPLDSIDFIQKVKATDVVFAVSAFTAFGVNHQYIEKMRVINTQKYNEG